MESMPQTPWIRIGDRVVTLEELPSLLDRAGVMSTVFRRLLLETAVVDIAIPEEEQIAFQKQFLASKGIETHEQLHQWLEGEGLTEDRVSQNMLEVLKLERFKDQRFSKDIEKIFLETKVLRDRVVYSLLRLKDKASAYELHLRLSEGDSTFTDLCEEHSQGPERDTGGLIGPVHLGRLHPSLREMLKISQPGQLWPPVEIDGLWVIVRLDKHLPACLDAAMEKQIRDDSFEAWVQQQLLKLDSGYRHELEVENIPGPEQNDCVVE